MTQAADLKRVRYMEFAREEMSLAKFFLAGSGVPQIPLAELNITAEELLTPLTLDPSGYGTVEFKQAVADFNGVTPDLVKRCTGTSQGVFFVIAGLLDRGDEIIVEQPAYEPLLRVAEYIGCEIKRLPRRFEDGWAIDPAALRKLVTPRTKMIVVSDLHNPTGRRIAADAWKDIAALAEETGCYVLSDEVYLDMIPGEPRPARAITLSDRIISIASLTKCWGLGPLRSGWILAAPGILRDLHRFSNLVDVFPPAISDNAILACLRRADTLQARMMPYITDNMTILREWAAATPALQWSEPDGGLMGYFKLPDGLSSRAFLKHCVEKHETNFSPGCFFEDDRFIRIACGTSPDILRAGLARVATALNELGH